MIHFAVIRPGGRYPTTPATSAPYWSFYNYVQVIIRPKKFALVHTGVRFSIPDGYLGQLVLRENLTFDGLYLTRSVIFSGVEEELVLDVENRSSRTYTLKPAIELVDLVLVRNYTLDFTPDFSPGHASPDDDISIIDIIPPIKREPDDPPPEEENRSPSPPRGTASSQDSSSSGEVTEDDLSSETTENIARALAASTPGSSDIDSVHTDHPDIPDLGAGCSKFEVEDEEVFLRPSAPAPKRGRPRKNL